MTRRDRNVILVVAAIALIAGFWFVVLAPTRKESSELTNKIAAQEQKLATAQAKVAAAQEAKRGYSADYAAVARLGQAVPADDDVASLVYQVDKAAGRKINFSSVKLKTSGGAAAARGTRGRAQRAGAPAATTALPPGATVGSAGFPTMPFTFAFAGRFFDVQQLLERFNRLTTRERLAHRRARPPADDRRRPPGRSRQRLPRADDGDRRHGVPRPQGGGPDRRRDSGRAGERHDRQRQAAGRWRSRPPPP